MKQLKLDLTKSIINIDLQDDCEINGLFIGKDSDSIASTIIINFAKSNINSRIIIKAVLYDKATINLDCKLIIPKGIKNIDGYLDIKVLNLSYAAKIDIAPGLEILENDVKCGHALTIGKPDQVEIEYLKSRGLTERQAINLIVQGFLL